jgi:hypothetical protein
VSGSSLGWDSSYHDGGSFVVFISYSRQIPGYYFDYGLSDFLPNPFYSSVILSFDAIASSYSQRRKVTPRKVQVISTLKMEAASSSKILVSIYKTTRRRIPNDCNLNQRHREDLKLHNLK